MAGSLALAVTVPIQATKAALAEEHTLTSHQPPCRVFTKAELAHFNGKDNPRMYVALGGKVYDVSASESFTAPGGYGELWGGKDATVALAKMSMDPADVGREDWGSLDDRDWESLESWERHFASKYPIVGRLSVWTARCRGTSTSSVWTARRRCADELRATSMNCRSEGEG